jgi:hypothetical protein
LYAGTLGMFDRVPKLFFSIKDRFPLTTYSLFVLYLVKLFTLSSVAIDARRKEKGKAALRHRQVCAVLTYTLME